MVMCDDGFSMSSARERQIRLHGRLDNVSGGNLARGYSPACKTELVTTLTYSDLANWNFVEQQRIDNLHSSIGLFHSQMLTD